MKWLITLTAVLLIGVFLYLRPTKRAPEAAQSENNVQEVKNIQMQESSTKAIARSDSRQPIFAVADTQSPKDVTHESFVRLLATTWEKIPKKSMLQKLSAEEVHEEVAPIQQAGDWLGRLATALEQNPSWEREGFSFYEKCTNEKSFADSVRALCYLDMQKLAQKNRYSLVDSKLDKKIISLAQSLDELN